MGILTGLTADKIGKLSLTRVMALTAADIAELTPDQAELISSAQGAGQLSLALRPLGDNQVVDTAGAAAAAKKKLAAASADGPVNIIRYGMARPRPQQQENPQ